MTFDKRLACLMAAINEDWSELEAGEVNGTLVVRVKDSVKAQEMQKEKRDRSA